MEWPSLFTKKEGVGIERRDDATGCELRVGTSIGGGAMVRPGAGGVSHYNRILGGIDYIYIRRDL